MEVKNDYHDDATTLQQLNLPTNITNISIYELSLSDELNDILEEAGYRNLGELLLIKHSDMMSIPNITEVLLDELETTIYAFKKQILDYYIRVGRGYFIEGDMQIYNSDNASPLERIYNAYPLIGNKILTKETTNKLNESLKILVDDFFNGHTINEFTMLAKMKITLALINLAKDWNSQDESSFWHYISLKIGFRNISVKLRDFFCKCIFETLREYKRWFIFTDSGNQYKSTVVAHAMTPKESWYAFYDFVFDFYTDVLNWDYRKNDPLISKMVMELNKRVSENEIIDEDIEISGKIYEIRDGIKKLIKFRPNYTNKLVNEMIEYINKLVNKEKVSPNDYLSLLGYEWYISRINNIDELATLTKDNRHNKSLAFDYKRIRSTYEFSNYEDLFVVMPEIRLDKTDFSKAIIQLYIKDDLITEESLSFYGNEFGKTLKHTTLPLNEYLYLCNDGFHIRVVVICDEDTIYDSKQDLYRNVICFQKQKETSVYKCKKDTSYHIFIPCNVNFDVQGYTEENLAEEYECVNCYYYRLGNNFAIKINEDIVSKDIEISSKENVIYPQCVKDVEYVKEGKVYQILDDVEKSKILIEDESLRNYTFRLNTQIIDNDYITTSNIDGINVYCIPLIWDEDNCCTVSIYNIEKNKHLAVKKYRLINGFNVSFSNEVFFESGDYDGAYVDISSVSHSEHISIYENDGSTLFLPWDNGSLEIKIPLITIYSYNGIAWNDTYYAWNGNIKQDEYIQLECPDECVVELFLGDNRIKSRRGKFYIGNDLVSLSTSTNNWIELKIKLSVNNSYKTYNIGHISSRERFKDNVRFEYHDDALYWNRGTEFIGKENKSMKLRIISPLEETLATYQLELDRDLIIKSPDIEIGEYRYEIVAETDDFFDDEQIIDYGSRLPIGEINERRFHNRRIKIRYITEENSDEFSRRPIKNTYIDKIEYEGICFVGSEDKDCPIYKGVMYYDGNEDVRYEYSFEENEDKYAINPVKIIYIDSDVISIKNNDDEGLYYYRYYDEKRTINKYYITDKDPDKLSNSKDLDNYSTADLYIYDTERI